MATKQMQKPHTPTDIHAFLDRSTDYSIVFNFLDVSQENIGIDVNVIQREITVYAKKINEYARKGFFWTFGIPVDAQMADTMAQYKSGILEIKIPKNTFAMSA